MRILVLSHMFPRSPTDWGGIFVCEQVKALRKVGVDVRVMAGEPIWTSWRSPRSCFWSAVDFLYARHPKVADTEGIPTYFVPFMAPPMRFWSFLAARCYGLGVSRWAGELRRVFPFDLVHAHTAYLDGNAAVRLGARFKTPVVLTEHTGPFAALTQTGSMRRQTQYVVNHVQRVVAVSKHLRQDMLAHVRVNHPENIQVFGNGVDVDLFHPGNVTPPDDGTVRGLWVGGFLPVKQPFLLLEAFAAAYRRNPALRLSMVGSGPLEEQIRSRVKELGLDRHVEVQPSATRRIVVDHMRKHHFLVISSESETFGLVAVEALACGRPVLTTRCGGPEETVGDTTRGELVDNSLEGLTQGFLRMATRVREFVPLELHQYARNQFSYPVIAKRLLALYRELLGT